MAKKKSLLQLRKGLDLNHTAHSGTHMTNILIATHGNHHGLGDSAVGVMEKSGHWKLAELGGPSPQLNRWPGTRCDPASVSMKWKVHCFPTDVADRMTLCARLARLARLAVSGHLAHKWVDKWLTNLPPPQTFSSFSVTITWATFLKADFQIPSPEIPILENKKKKSGNLHIKPIPKCLCY